ncbi:DUF4274 domain-containing protein [Paenibacillus sp. GCM10027627]|uniref:DUF4274 domain-containing protein n=1 Tax=unclassified Paenibacillus TaxID=185978 RepID=UPI00362693C2
MNEEIQKLKDLLYSEDCKSTAAVLNNIQDALHLHIVAANYNWDSGFEIPKAILSNKKCDFGTGLFLFFRADG